MSASANTMYQVRRLAQVLLVALVVFLVFADLTNALSKKFIKGFLLGHHMAKHHDHIVVVAKKHHG